MLAPSTDTSSERVAAKYVAVGRQLKVHREARDIDVSDLWPRYRLIQINSALSTAESRAFAVAELTRIQQDINARCESPR